MGLSVGYIYTGQEQDDKKKAYECDITYGTNSEFGFDYLRDNMVIYKEQLVLRDLHFAIIDEVDSVLIDEARTPLIISGQSDKSTDLYESANRFACSLKMFKIKEMDDKAKDEKLLEDVENERATITNMGAELGATTSVFPSDDVTKAFLKGSQFEIKRQELEFKFDRENLTVIQICHRYDKK